MKTNLNIRELSQIALMTTLLCVSAYIVIPLPFSPVALTAQTLIVNLTALLFTPRQAAFTIITYVLLGFVGLPVFSGGIGGPAKLFGPTGGYILAWLITTPLIARIKGSRYSFLRYCAATICIGMSVSYLLGSAYMRVVTHMSWQAALAASVYPFVPLDLLKCAAASIIAKPVQNALKCLNAA